MANILEVKGLCKTYPNFALSDINFTVPEDCVVGFIGINGSGKTTTLRCLLGLALKATPHKSGTMSAVLP